MLPSKRYQRNRPLLRLSTVSPLTFRAVVRGATSDFLTQLCALAIAYATQQVKSPRLIPFLKKHKRFIFKVGDCKQSSKTLKDTLLKSRRAHHVLKPLILHSLNHVSQVPDDKH